MFAEVLGLLNTHSIGRNSAPQFPLERRGNPLLPVYELFIELPAVSPVTLTGKSRDRLLRVLLMRYADGLAAAEQYRGVCQNLPLPPPSHDSLEVPSPPRGSGQVVGDGKILEKLTLKKR